MTHYRIYLLQENGSIVSGQDADCADDAEALALARTLVKPAQFAEVWTGTRSLGKVTAKP